MESDISLEIYGKINLEIDWGFHRDNILNQITRQSPQNHDKISIKSILSILYPYYLHNFYRLLETKIFPLSQSSVSQQNVLVAKLTHLTMIMVIQRQDNNISDLTENKQYSTILAQSSTK